MRLHRLSLAAQSLLYIGSGINHFWHRDFYVKIMPPHYDDPASLVALTGALEILGGAGLLLPATRKPAAVGIAAMLCVFLDVHIHMLRHPERYPQVPEWALVARLPLQALLVAWALSAMRER